MSSLLRRRLLGCNSFTCNWSLSDTSFCFMWANEIWTWIFNEWNNKQFRTNLSYAWFFNSSHSIYVRYTKETQNFGENSFWYLVLISFWRFALVSNELKKLIWYLNWSNKQNSSEIQWVKYLVVIKNKFGILLQPKQQTPVHIVSSRQTATATSILRILLQTAGKDIRLKTDAVSTVHFES